VRCLRSTATQAGQPTHLLQFIHQIGGVLHDLIVGIVEAPFNYLIHDMEIACVGVQSTCPVARAETLTPVGNHRFGLFDLGSPDGEAPNVGGP
jgi:hypothetical protein